MMPTTKKWVSLFTSRTEASRLALLFATIGLLSAAVLAAHHGTSLYAMDKEIVLRGTIREWSWSNPHTWLSLRVPGVDGRIDEWSLESAPPAYLARQGWSETTLTAGEKVSATICLLRMPDGSKTGILLEVAREHGEVLVVRPPGSFGRMKR
jgi:uncharacterized protein DUF6152